MAVTREDFEILDERYVQVSDCKDIQSETDKKFANDDKRIDMIVHDFNAIKWLVGIVATATVGQLVVMIFGKLGGV